MQRTNPDALAMAAFTALAAICGILRSGRTLDWPALRDGLRASATHSEARLPDVSNPRAQDDVAQLLNVLLGVPPAFPPPAPPPSPQAPPTT